MLLIIISKYIFIRLGSVISVLWLRAFLAIQTTEINSEVNLWTRFLVPAFNRLPARYWYEYGALFTNTNYFRIELKSCEIHLFSRTFWLFLSLSTFGKHLCFAFIIFNICNPMFLLWKLFALFFALNSLKSQSAF